MLGRGEWRSLWVGVLIAVPSGAGVALSVLGGNAGSLVGVAISASLLPPAVNCGVFWAASVVLAISGNQSHAIFYTGRETVDTETNKTINLYEPRYDNDNMSLESFYLGLISVVLTIVNILCIILTGVLILRLKEVTSEKIPQKFAHFWRRDIREHRKEIQTDKAYHKKFRDHPDQRPNLESIINNEGLEGTILSSIFDKVAQDEEMINIRQSVVLPGSAMVPRGHQQYNPVYRQSWAPNYHKNWSPSFTAQPKVIPLTSTGNGDNNRLRSKSFTGSSLMVPICRFSPAPACPSTTPHDPLPPQLATVPEVAMPSPVPDKYFHFQRDRSHSGVNR
jgi:hypothetical protein